MTNGQHVGLSTGWAWTSLAEIAELKGGITKGQQRKPGETLRPVPYLRVANVQRGYLDLTDVRTIEATDAEVRGLALRPGDILFNEGGDRDKLGRGWVWRGELDECIHQNHVFRARLYDQSIAPKFVSWYANSVAQSYFFNEGKQTTNLASINLTKLGALPLPIPPTTAQRRIVAAIETHLTRLDVAVAALQRAGANLKRYRAAVLKAAVEGRLVPTEAELARAEGRQYQSSEGVSRHDGMALNLRTAGSRFKRAVAAADQDPDSEAAERPELPEGWCDSVLGELVLRSEYGTSVKCEYSATGVPVLRIPNIAQGRIELSDVKYATRALNLSDQDVLHLGDVLVCRTNGSVNLIGKAAVVTATLDPPHTFASYLLRFRLVEDQILPRWLHLYLSSPRGRRFIEQNAASSAGQHNISLGLMHRMPLPFPPLDEQERIVAEVERRLSVIEELETAIEHGLKRAERLRQAILKRAFEGRLVPQDPDDEPASVLLERIRAERDEPGREASGGRGRIGGRRGRSGRRGQMRLFDAEI
ncbi:MAG: hypothetical protein ACRDJE_01310 [Dehalococcoidia bacterium]